MVNGLGVLGWGVGGIEAEAAMLGQPVSMLIPKVVGFKLTGELPEGATATDLVLTITEMLRKHGVVGKFVEFYGDGVAAVPLANRATIGNMSPEYGSTVAIFPIDDETVRYLRMTGRADEQVALVEAYAKAQGLWHDPAAEPALLRADRARPVDRRAVHRRPEAAAGPGRAVRRQGGLPRRARRTTPGPTDEQHHGVDESSAESFPASDAPAYHGTNGSGAPHGAPGPRRAAPAVQPGAVSLDGQEFEVDHGHVVIAAITSCTNTSNPSVMIGAALLAKKAVERGLERKPWVKTTLAPGSKVVMDYYDRAGLTPYLDKLGFNLVGYGCTTCIGNSGPLPEAVSKGVNDNDLAVVSVLSGNRNFEGRINPDVKMNYLMSPPLVVAYALAGSMDIDITTEPLGHRTPTAPTSTCGTSGRPARRSRRSSTRRSRRRCSAAATPTSSPATSSGRTSRRRPATPSSGTPESTYVRKPPYFEGMPADPEPVTDIEGARVLAKLGDSVTTDHISPAGSIKADSPAGAYLQEHGVDRRDFNSYGSRRGNHEVMIRGTFANIRLRNQLAPGTEGGFTRDFTAGGEVTTIYDAAQHYAEAGTPLVILAGKEYGSGSSRDWAAKGTALLGVRAVIAESYERIHRSNLIGMGVLPLQFRDGESAESLGLTGEEEFSVTGVTALNEGASPREVTVRAGGHRVPGPAADRHAGGGGLLPPRRDHAVRPAVAAPRLIQGSVCQEAWCAAPDRRDESDVSAALRTCDFRRAAAAEYVVAHNIPRRPPDREPLSSGRAP